MAETSTYKPKGTILSPYEDSAKMKLKSIALPAFEQFKATGKVDVNALNDLAKALNFNLTEIVKYIFELVNQQSDTTTDKIKSELKSLSDAIVNDLSEKSEIDIDYSAILSKLDLYLSDSSDQYEHAKDDFNQKIDELKLQFSESNEQTSSSSIESLNAIDATYLKDSFAKQLVFISDSLSKLEKNISKFQFKLPKISFPKIKLPKIDNLIKSLKNFKLPKFKFPKFKFPKIQPLKRIRAIGSKVKNAASKVGKAVVKPFAAVGSMFKKLAFGNDAFTFMKLRKFLKQFFAAKNVSKWLDNFLKKYSKILKKHVKIIIDPIKKMIFAAIDAIGSIIHSVVNKILLSFFPVIAAIWAIFAAVILLGYLLYKAYKWFTDTAIPWIVDFSKKIWNGIKNVGKMIWKGIRYVFYDMWIDLGKWLWKKLMQFGNWIWKKVKSLGKWLRTTIVDPILNWIKNIIAKIKSTALYKGIVTAISSIRNLIAKIKDVWGKLKWDENKSFMENMMTYWENIKAAIKDWWKSSPFKTYYDKLVNWLSDLVKPIKDWWELSSLKKKYDEYIQPLIDNLSDLKKAIFSAFSWDSSKSFFENLIGIWDNLKEKVTTWWNASSFKTYYDKLVNWISDIMKPVRDWWNSLQIGKKISDIFDWLKELPTKIWEKIKGFFGKAGEVVEDTWNWLMNKVSGSKDKKDEKEFTVDEAVEALNKERTRTMEIDVGTIKDILDIVTNISDLLFKTIDLKLDQLLGNGAFEAIPSQQYSINNSLQVLNNITMSSNVENGIQNDSNDQFKLLNAKLDDIGEFMSKFACTVQSNFLLIILKLDEKPNLLPIPFTNTDAGNTALMENL